MVLHWINDSNRTSIQHIFEEEDDDVVAAPPRYVISVSFLRGATKLVRHHGAGALCLRFVEERR